MKYLLGFYQWLIAMPVLLVLTILTAVLTSIGSILGGGKWWGYYPAHVWSKCWCWLFGIDVTVINKEYIDSTVSYVFIANHQGAYDIFSIYGYLNHNFRWMMKKSLENIPFVGLACRCAGHIMVDRSSSSSIKKTMDIAKKQLRNGMSLVVFPEGARSWTGKMRQFKRGAFKLALDFNLPIVPITIDGSFKVMPRTTYLISPGKITLTIHKPIEPTQQGHDIDMVMKHSFESIQSSLPEYDKWTENI